jgi:hypothetical protein
MGLANLNLRYLMRPRLWFEYFRTMRAGARHSAIGFARAAMMSIFFLHLERQTTHVIKQLNLQIGELETSGEDSYVHKRQYVIAEGPGMTAHVWQPSISF